MGKLKMQTSTSSSMFESRVSSSMPYLQWWQNVVDNGQGTMVVVIARRRWCCTSACLLSEDIQDRGNNIANQDHIGNDHHHHEDQGEHLIVLPVVLRVHE
jgi:hypothetical protein